MCAYVIFFVFLFEKYLYNTLIPVFLLVKMQFFMLEAGSHLVSENGCLGNISAVRYFAMG